MSDDDPFDTDDPVEPKDEEATSVVRSQRAHIKQLEKELKTLRKDTQEVEELRQFKAQYEQTQKATQARTVFTEVGLPDKLADLFVKVNAEADPTPEAVRAFAEDYGLAPQQSADPAPAAPAVQPFTPTVGGTPPSGLISRDEFDAMMRDPSQRPRALQLAQQGRVQLRNSRAYSEVHRGGL